MSEKLGMVNEDEDGDDDDDDDDDDIDDEEDDKDDDNYCYKEAFLFENDNSFQCILLLVITNLIYNKTQIYMLIDCFNSCFTKQ